MLNIVIRLIVALVVTIFSLFSYFGSKEYNPVTGEKQYVSLTQRQEIALGLQAVPEMIQKYGGLYPDQKHQNYIDKVGGKLISGGAAKDTEWKFEFHLLNEPNVVNAFALPGGQIFITTGLYKLFQKESQLAAVLGHEIGHVVARHSAQRIAKSKLTKGITDAVVVASGDARAGQIAAVVGQLVNMKYSRGDEVQADHLGVIFMSDGGYDPRGMIQVMQILGSLGSGSRAPEFFSTHPNPENRIGKIQNVIQEKFPNGIPDKLIP